MATDTHYLVYRMDESTELIAVFKFKFAQSNPGCKIYVNPEELTNVILIAGDKVDFVRISPDWDKVEGVPFKQAHSKAGGVGNDTNTAGR